MSKIITIEISDKLHEILIKYFGPDLQRFTEVLLRQAARKEMVKRLDNGLEE
jgi:hypothetical protein